MTAVRPALIARLYRAIEENRMSDAVLLLSQVFSYYGHSRRSRDAVFLSELRRLGDEYVASGDALTAEEHFKLAVALYEAFFSEENEEALASMRRLCDLLSAQGRDEELERMLEWAYVVVQRYEAQLDGKAAATVTEAINWHSVFNAEMPSTGLMTGTNNQVAVAGKPPIQILLVEDNPDDAELVSDQLAEGDTNVQINWASELREGISKASQGGVDVILLDLGLPDSIALDTFYRMTSSAPAVPIIILTGLDDRNLALKAIKRGAHDYLVKGRDDAKSVLRSIIDAVHRRRDREVERLTQTAAARAIEESIENAPLALLFLDGRGVIRNINDKWCEVMSLKARTEHVGKTFRDVFPWISHDRFGKLLGGEALQVDDIQAGEQTMSLVAWPVRSPGNGIIGALVSIRCSSERCLRGLDNEKGSRPG